MHDVGYRGAVRGEGQSENVVSLLLDLLKSKSKTTGTGTEADNSSDVV